MARDHRVFEWDEVKASGNLAKHRVSFECAAESLMHDANAIDDVDARHDPARWITLALGARGLLAVVWIEAEGAVTRIISARKATPAEKQRYVDTSR